MNKGIGVAGDHNELTGTQGRRRLVPADSISEYVQLLLTEAGGDDDRAA